MSVEQLDVVDIISTDQKTGHVVLTIADDLDWSNTVQHQVELQAKFNKYLAFIESGEILTRYPDAKDRPAAIRVYFKYQPDQEGWQFLAINSELRMLLEGVKNVLDRLGLKQEGRHEAAMARY